MKTITHILLTVAVAAVASGCCTTCGDRCASPTKSAELPAVNVTTSGTAPVQYHWPITNAPAPARPE